MNGIESILATASIIGWVTQPSCSCPLHKSGITALAWRPGGYLAICALAQPSFSAEKAKAAGCISGGARRRSDIKALFREIDAGDQPVAERVDGDDLELLAAGGADHQLVIHHAVADGDAVFQNRLVLRKLREGLGIAGLDRGARGFRGRAAQSGNHAILGEKIHIGVEILRSEERRV